jgi:hypothetical protein
MCSICPVWHGENGFNRGKYSHRHQAQCAGGSDTQAITAAATAAATSASHPFKSYSRCCDKNTITITPDFESYSGNRAVSIRRACILRRVILVFIQCTTYSSYSTASAT